MGRVSGLSGPQWLGRRTRCCLMGTGSLGAAPGAPEPVKVTRPSLPHARQDSSRQLTPCLCCPCSHPFCVKLLELCKAETSKSKDVQKLRSSIAV